MVRGTGKFKQKRGGGRNFSKDMILDENGTAVSAARKRAEDAASDNSDNSEEESAEEESEEEEVDPTKDKPELSRTERRELKKKQAAEKLKANGDEDEDEDLINPNHVTKKLKISDLGAPQELSRKEREAKDKQDAKDRYWKLHVQGKTEQAKTDLARLAKIKAEREAAQAKRKAETEAKASEIAAKTKAQQGRR